MSTSQVRRAELPAHIGGAAEFASSSFIVATFAPLAALTNTRLRRLLIAIIVLDIPFGVSVHLGYNETEALQGALGGLDFSVTTIALALLYAGWWLDHVARAHTAAHRSWRGSAAAIAYVVFAVASVFVARDTTLALNEVALVIQTFLLYVYLLHWVRTRDEVMFVGKAMILALLSQSVLMIALEVLGASIKLPGFYARLAIEMGAVAGPIYRVAGTLGSANGAAGFIAMVAPVGLAFLFADVGHRWKVLAGCALACGAVALVLTFSRGGWIATALAVALVLAMAVRRRGRASLVIPAAVLICVMLLALFFGTAIGARLFQDEDSASSARVRIPLMQLAFNMIKANPVLGVGANNFTVRMEEYRTPELSGEWLYAVHNRYLLIWSELGLGGLLALLWFLLTALRNGWKTWRGRDPLLALMALGLAAGVVGHMFHISVDLFRGRWLLQQLWVTAALLLAMSDISTRQPVNPRRELRYASVSRRP